MFNKTKIFVISSVIIPFFLYSQIVYASGIIPIFGLKNEPITVHNVGNRLTKTNSDGQHDYGYDDLYRLTSATLPNETYTYDEVGNRLTNQDYSDWDYNAGNQLEGYNGVSFTYDNNGNTTSKTDPSGTTSSFS